MQADALRKIHLPSIVGCAFGFAAAGSGVGSLLGMILHCWFFPPLPKGHGTVEQRILAQYGGTIYGILFGILIGCLVGIVYAVLVRRARFEEWMASRRPDLGP